MDQDQSKKRIALFLFDTISDVKSSSESSDDNEEEPKRKIAKIEKYIEITVMSYDAKQFQYHFRMKKATMYMLEGRFEESRFSAKHDCGELPISSEKATMMTLWYLVNTESFRQICDRFGVGISSAHRVIVRVLNFVISLRKEYIVWPCNNRKRIISDNFKNKQNINNIMGAIDGCHVKINRPPEHEETYVNRKQYHSLIIQAVSDHTKLFIDICCGEPGSLHDARVLRRSSLYRRAQLPNYFNEYFLIGDSAYPALNWLVTPFKDNGNLTENERLFNYKLSSTRMIIEHAFGLLKGRFRRLNHITNLDIQTCVKIMMSCCILHNICIVHKDGTEISLDNGDVDLNCNTESTALNADTVGVNRRTEIFRDMFGNL